MTSPQNMRRAPKRFLVNEKGVAGVEFALILPLMLTFYFGTFEVTQALSCNRQVALTASTVTNLVSQYTTISQGSQMPDILAASAKVLAPYPVGPAKVVVSGIIVDGKGANPTVQWSVPYNGGAALVTGAAVTLPTGLTLAPNSMVILGQTSYAYTAPVQFIKLGTWNLSSNVYMLPRASTTITLAP